MYPPTSEFGRTINNISGGLVGFENVLWMSRVRGGIMLGQGSGEIRIGFLKSGKCCARDGAGTHTRVRHHHVP